jgi:hypothetical protein
LLFSFRRLRKSHVLIPALESIGLFDVKWILKSFDPGARLHDGLPGGGGNRAAFRHVACGISGTSKRSRSAAMAAQTVEQKRPDDRTDEEIDKAVEDTFPASDPPATGGATQIEPQSADIPGTAPDEDDVPDEQTPAEPSPGDAPPAEGSPQGQ